MSISALSPLNQKIIAQKQAPVSSQQAPSAPLKEDSVEFKNKPQKAEKSALSKGAKIAILIAGLLAAVGIGVLAKKKIDASKVKQLAQCIEFKEANTVEEAIEFGRKNLGIRKYKGFGAEDLDVINWANEGLVKVNNISHGKAKMPKMVEYVESITSKAGEDGDASMNGRGVLSISRKKADGFKQTIISYIKECSGPEDKKQKMIDTLTYKKANDYYINFCKNNPDIIKKVTSGNTYYFSMFGNIQHEMGHWQHKQNLDSAMYYSLGKPQERPKELAKGAQELLDEFEKSQEIAAQVSEYAKASPLEFVAEVYSGMCDRRKFSNEVIELYKKLGGAMLA